MSYFRSLLGASAAPPAAALVTADTKFKQTVDVYQTLRVLPKHVAPQNLPTNLTLHCVDELPFAANATIMLVDADSYNPEDGPLRTLDNFLPLLLQYGIADYLQYLKQYPEAANNPKNFSLKADVLARIGNEKYCVFVKVGKSQLANLLNYDWEYNSIGGTVDIFNCEHTKQMPCVEGIAMFLRDYVNDVSSGRGLYMRVKEELLLSRMLVVLWWEFEHGDGAEAVALFNQSASRDTTPANTPARGGSRPPSASRLGPPSTPLEKELAEKLQRSESENQLLKVNNGKQADALVTSARAQDKQADAALGQLELAKQTQKDNNELWSRVQGDSEKKSGTIQDLTTVLLAGGGAAMPAAATKKAARSKKAVQQEESSSDEESMDEQESKPSAVAAVTKKGARSKKAPILQEASSSDSDEDSGDSDDEALQTTAPKKAPTGLTRKSMPKKSSLRTSVPLPPRNPVSSTKKAPPVPKASAKKASATKSKAAKREAAGSPASKKTKKTKTTSLDASQQAALWYKEECARKKSASTPAAATSASTKKSSVTPSKTSGRSTRSSSRKK